MNNQKKLANKRKLKYGALSVVLTTIVIAAVIVVNVICSAVVYNKNIYLDLTPTQLFELSDAGRELLDTIDPNAKIKVRFCSPFDTLEANMASKMVFELVKEMCAEYDNITYDYVDPVKNYAEVIKYKSSSADTIDTDSIIVESGTEYRVFSLENMYIIDTDGVTAWAFNGEQKLITAMVSCTLSEKPVAYYTNTHGEYLSESMVELFEEAGYDVLPIDLTKDEISSDGRLIIISCPKYDFEGISELTAGRKSEIEKIDDFLDGYGNIMVFMDPTVERLPELEDFLAEWGIEFEDAVLYDATNSIDTQHYALVGDYSLEDSVGGMLVRDIVSVGTPPKTIAYYASPIKILFTEKENREVGAAIYSSETAQKIVGEEAVEKGQYPLVTVSREGNYINNVKHYSYVFAVGSPFFAEDMFLTPTYANSDILYTMMIMMGKEQVPIDLEFKIFEDTSLDITSAQASTWTWTLMLVIPTIVFGLGIVIFIRRKHK